MPEKNPPADLVLVGHILGAYGVHGWVRIRPYSKDAEVLLTVKQWWLDKPSLGEVKRAEVKWHNDEVVAGLVGVSDRDEALSLKGAAIWVERKRFPKLDEDEFYWVDLVGLNVSNIEGKELGVVAGLIDNAAHPILKVVPASLLAGQKVPELLVPFVEHVVKTVDLAKKTIVVDWDWDYVT